MVEMGLQSIANVSQIVAFLKIDEVRNLIITQDNESLVKAQVDMIQSQNNTDAQQIDIEKLNLLFQQEDIQQQDGQQRKKKPQYIEPSQALKIQKYIQDVNSGDIKTEEHYYENCPIELSSILAKVLAETLVISGAIQSENQIPIELMKLVQSGSRKADPQVEQEIYLQYLVQSKKMIEDKFSNLAEDNSALRSKIEKLQASAGGLFSRDKVGSSRLDNKPDENKVEGVTSSDGITNLLTGMKSRLRNASSKLSQSEAIQVNQLQEVSNTQQLQSQRVNDAIKRDLSAQLLGQENDKRRVSSLGSRPASSKRSPMRQLVRGQDVAVLEQKMEGLKIQMQEQKLKYKEITMQLASKIVLLEEQLDEKRIGQDQDLNELEVLQREELEKTKLGIQQREQELLFRQNEYKNRAENAELELKGIREQVAYLNSELERITNFQKDFDRHISLKDQEIFNYKENVSHYVNIRVNQRNVFGLTFEINSENESMINEPMLKYYLNKCLKLDKEKFRFISKEQQHFQIDKEPNGKVAWKDMGETSDEEVTVCKVLIEIIDDQENVDKYFKLFKNQIREGTSILYDLQPLYLSMNLGQCGLQVRDPQQLRDFHIIRKRGIMMKKNPYVVSVLRHIKDPLSFKILALSTNSGEEYILDIIGRDLFELTEGHHQLLEISEPDSIVETIIDNLTITLNEKTGVKILACEHKVYFNSLFISRHVPNKNERNKVNKYLEKGESVITSQPSQDSIAYRNTSFRNNQILQHVDSKTNKVNDEFKSKIHNEVECQTDVQQQSFTNLLNHSIFKSSSSIDEIFITTYQGYQRVGKALELKVKIDEGQKSGTIVFSFEEIRTKDRCQVCLLQSQMRDRYVIHSECVKFQIGEEEQHLMLLTFERFQEDAILIKMHDMKFAASEEFFITKKSNGQYARLTRSAGIEALIANGKEHEELRNLIFDLTFTLSVPSQQILYANLEAVEQQMIEQSQQNPDSLQDPFQLPIIKRSQQTRENNKESQIDEMLQNAKLKLDATHRFQADPYALPSGVLLQKHERGELLYRNIYNVRCCFEDQEEKEHSSLISFYLKKDSYISVEVFLFKETQKMSIASQVSSLELFGQDYQSMSFFQKTEMLDQMMEKLYVLSEGGQYHLKVENEAIPMSILISKRKQALLNKPPEPVAKPTEEQLIEQQLQPQRPTSEMNKYQLQAQIDSKMKEIEANREEIIRPDKTITIKSYAQINDILYEYQAIFLMKQEKDQPQIQISPSKKKQSNKKNIERQANMSNNIEDISDFDFILIEVDDKKDNKYTSLVSVKKLNALMMTNPFEIMKNLLIIQSKDKEKLVEYLKRLTSIDEVNKIMRIETFQPSKELILQMYSNEIGGIYIRRDENQARFDLEAELIEKRLLMNQEVDMAEFSYDVKLFQVFSKNNIKQALSYSLEMFSLNEPDLFYRYNYALHEQSSAIHSPIHMGYDIINLIENPMSKVKQNEEAKRRQEFQQVYSKYLDNRLLLVVNEQIFPHQISFCLHESSSRLHWSYTFDPQQADPQYIEAISKTSLNGRWNIEIGQLSILDQGTTERFIALIMNDILGKAENTKILMNDLREDNWNDLGDTEALRYDLVKSKRIGGNIAISLSKMGVDCLSIELQNSNYCAPEPGKVTNVVQTLSKSITKIGLSQQEQKKKSIELKGPIEQQKINVVKFIINASQRNKFISKLVKVRDQAINKMLLVTCHLKDNEIIVKVIELQSINEQGDSSQGNLYLQVLYNYVFKEKKASGPSQTQDHSIDRYHLEDAISEVYTCGQAGIATTQIIQRASKLYDTLSGKKPQAGKLSIFQDHVSITQRRLLSNASRADNSKQQMILHRKTFFDETHEKLIIVSVSVKCQLTRKKGHGTAQLCLEEVDTFKLFINEPETQRKMTFDLPILSCFKEEELFNGVDLKNLQHLKKMARVLIEERAIIKRVAKEQLQNSNEEDNQNLYTIEINLSHITPLNPNQPTPRSESPITGQGAGNQVTGQNYGINDADQQNNQSLNRGVGSKSKNTNSLDNAASSSLRNAGHIPEDEGGDEFEAMESALAANKNLTNMKVSSGQTNLSSSSQVAKSQSLGRQAEIYPPGQSVIEEEGSQEEYEDSPDVSHKRGGELIQHDMMMKGSKERYTLPADEEGYMDEEKSNQEAEGENDDGRNMGDEEEEDDQSINSTTDLLYERELSDTHFLQIFRASPRDPYSLFQVRQRSMIDGRISLKVDIDHELVEQIIEGTGLPENAAEQHMPELFDAISEYVITKVIRQE